MVKNAIILISVFASLLLLWETASHFLDYLSFILPAPSNILLLLWSKSDRFLLHTKVTLQEMLGGMALSFAVAFPLAWFMMLWNSVRLVLQPIFIIIQCLPMFTLAPIIVIWFDWSYMAIVVPTALMIFYPLTMNIYQGLQATPQSLIDYFRVNQATEWQLFFKLHLPWALPYIFAGLRISTAIAGIGAVAGEWAGAQEGLGILMIESRRGADLETSFGALFCLVFVSLILYRIATYLEKKVIQRKKDKGFTNLAARTCIVLLALLSLSGCKERTKETRMLLDWVPNPNHVPFYVGMEKGFFNEQSINLKILKAYDLGSAVPFLESGQAELAINYMPQTLCAMARGIELETVGLLVKEPLNALIFRKYEGINQPLDLNKKIVGYCLDGSNTAVLDTILEENQIIPSEKRNVSFDLVSTLGTKRVDFIYGGFWNIEIENLRTFGIETDYFPLTDLGIPSYYELIVIASKRYLEQDKEFANHFQKALQDSIDYSVKNPEEAFAIYLKANPDKTGKTAEWEMQAWLKTIPVLAANQEVDQNLWRTYSQWQIEKGIISKQD